MELDFFTGYHGSGKTYTANELLNSFDAGLVDGGPIIRRAFTQSGMSNFDDWVKYQEKEFGTKWDDYLILDSVKTTVKDEIEPRKHLFIVGNRNIDTINFLKENLSDGEVDKILFFEKPFSIMKSGYELRTGEILTDEEFLQILYNDEQMGLLGVKKYVEANPETNSIIKSDRYDIFSIELTGEIILRTRKK